jgi:hypothetical protein
MSLRLLAIFVFLALFIFSAHGEKTEIQVKDVAVFRIQKKTIFFSDLEVYLKEFKKFRCLYKHSRILNSLKLDYKNLNKIPKIRASYNSIDRQKIFVNNVIRLIKMQVFASRYKVNVSSKQIASIKTMQCEAAHFKTWSNELKSLLQMELYILERFPITRQSDNKELDQFIESVDKKIKHAVFF